MNLVAKEYVAAQEPHDPGVLVLSRFAGAAGDLTQALMVNPYDPEEMADAIHQALCMPIEERRQRWEALYGVVGAHTAVAWCRDFLGALTDPDARRPLITPAPAH